jgi:uncharacterized repeat protein (TIGR01451 family)
MRENDAHPHLSTTSFWCCWEPGLWGDEVTYPDLGYADIHQYILADDPDREDLVRWFTGHSRAYHASQVGKPIQFGETGIEDESGFFSAQTDPTWWHNLVWANIDYPGVSSPQYWHAAHLEQVGYEWVVGAYTAFMQGIPLNNGHYQDVQAQTSDDRLRALGQKDRSRSRAHLWIQHAQHTWKNVADGVAISPVGGTVTISGLRPGPYTVEWWDTNDGTVVASETVYAALDLVLTLPYDLRSDIAAKVTWIGPDLSLSSKAVSELTAQQGDVLTYALTLVNSGAMVANVILTDTIPAGTSYVPGSASASPLEGTLDDAGGIHWFGTLGDTQVRIVFAVQVETAAPAAIWNRVAIHDGYTTLERSVGTVANGYRAFLPLILRE